MKAGSSILLIIIVAVAFLLIFGGIDSGKIVQPREVAKSSGYGTLAVTINYEDGSSQRFQADKFAFLPMTIKDFRGTIRSVQVLALVYVEHTLGDTNSWELSVTDSDVSLCVAGGGASPFYYLEKDKTLAKTGTNCKSGIGVDIELGTWSASQLESGITSSGKSAGDYMMKFETTLTLEISSSAGSDSKSTSTWAYWDFTYEIGGTPAEGGKITSLSITTGIYPLR